MHTAPFSPGPTPKKSDVSISGRNIEWVWLVCLIFFELNYMCGTRASGSGSWSEGTSIIWKPHFTAGKLGGEMEHMGIVTAGNASLPEEKSTPHPNIRCVSLAKTRDLCHFSLPWLSLICCKDLISAKKGRKEHAVRTNLVFIVAVDYVWFSNWWCFFLPFCHSVILATVLSSVICHSTNETNDRE